MSPSLLVYKLLVVFEILNAVAEQWKERAKPSIGLGG